MMSFGSMDSVFSELKLRTRMFNNGYDADDKFQDGDPDYNHSKKAGIQRFDFSEDFGKDDPEVAMWEQEERDKTPLWNCKLVARMPELCFGKSTHDISLFCPVFVLVC